MLILLVEDDPAHAAAIQRAVEAGGSESEVKVVGTLREFRRSSVDRPPNIAVMDLNLPDGRATEVLTCPPEAGPFPILVMTSYGNEQVAVEAIKAGALDYVVKSPDAFADMPHTIERALHEWKLLQERRQADEALEFKNIILATQQEASIDGILVVDENGEIISFNRRFVDIWDIPSVVAESKSDEQILKSVMNKLVSPEEFVGKLEQLHEDRNEISQDEIALKDGRTFDRYSAPMLGEGGKYYGRVWYFRDITERKQAEVALRESEASLTAAQRIAHIGSWQWDIQNDTAHWSDETFRIFEQVPGKLQEHRKRFVDMVHPEDRERVSQALADAVNGVREYDLDYRLRLPDGGEKVIHAQAEVLRDKDGKAVMMQGTVQDITERKKAEAALREKDEWFRTVFENASDGMFFLSPSGEIVLVNESFAALHGYSVAEILKMNLRDLDAPESYRLFPERIRRVLAGENLTFEVAHHHKNGQLLPLEVAVNLVTVGGKKYILASHRDIAERKRAENELRDVNRALRLTSQCNQEMVRATDESALLQAVCRIAVEHGGYRLAWVGFAEQDEARSVRPVAQAGFEDGYLGTINITWADTERGRGPTGTAIRTGQPVLARNIPTDPAFAPWRTAAIQRGYASSIALPLLNEGRCLGALMIYAGEPDAFNPKEVELLAELANDLAYGISALRHRAEHKRAEVALRASQERLREIFEASPNVTSVFQMEGPNLRRTWVSPNLERLFGYTVEEALQPHWWSAHVHPEDVTRVITDSGRILAREHIVHEYRFLRRDGSVVWIHDEMHLLLDATGQPHEVVGAWTDITERKELETHLLRTQRLESVGRLASGIAHDLNNILAPMLMVPPLLREVVKDPELRNMVDLVETNAQRGSSIIKQLLTFGRGMEGERVPVQLRALVNEMSGIIRETFHKNITVRREMPPDIWLVSGDATQLHQVLMNLCVNARDAMPEGGTLTLKLDNQEFDESFARMTPGAQPGRYVCLSVTDTGQGIAPEHLDKIFDPFFTTKELGKGTGLGLSTVLGIVQSHGGFIQVHSQPGRGTEFRAYLPASEAVEAQSASQANQSLPQGGGELVLVVDDESSVRQVARKLLERNGYRVIEAAEGAEGITQYVAHQKEVPVVVTDLVMPVMDGPAFIRVLRRLNPQVRVIVMTGYQSKLSLPADLGVLGEAHLSKPFTGPMLLQTLQRVLHPEPSPKN